MSGLICPKLDFEAKYSNFMQKSQKLESIVVSIFVRVLV